MPFIRPKDCSYMSNKNQIFLFLGRSRYDRICDLVAWPIWDCASGRPPRRGPKHSILMWPHISNRRPSEGIHCQNKNFISNLITILYYLYQENQNIEKFSSLTIFKPIYECRSLVNKPKICIIQVIKILFFKVKNFFPIQGP